MERYRSWIIGQALPLWADRGFDSTHDRFVERLDWSGRPLTVPHRAMVQARQIYAYAHAAALGWFPQGAMLADAAAYGLRRDFVATSGGRASIAFAIDPATGAVLSDVRDAYTHAFVLFALAHLHAITRDAASLTLAREIVAFIDEELSDDAHGGLHDALPQTGAKRQNPHMHLLEAYLALAAVAPGEGFEERADHLVSLFHDRFVHHEHGILLEHFAEDWSMHPEPALATIFEPGHHFEWIWLLGQHERMGIAEHGVWRARLRASATRQGLLESGLVLDEVRLDGSPAKRSTRLWPHTEAIKAAAVWHAEGDRTALAFARGMTDALFTNFLDRPFPGGWADHLAPDLTPLVDYVPASSLYHLVLAATETDAFDVAADGRMARPLVHT